MTLPEPNSKSTSASSMSTMSYVEAPLSHYHTVHGTSHISHHPQCYPYTPLNTPSSMADGSVSPVGGCPVYYSKQRTRSHSGPTYPVGFTQSVRHSALISAGMATLGTSQRRRQSDDSEQASSSLRSRASPSGSSFFDSFRYVLYWGNFTRRSITLRAFHARPWPSLLDDKSLCHGLTLSLSSC